MQVASDQVVFLGTGGTIAGLSEHGCGHLGYRSGQIGIEQLLAQIPGLSTLDFVNEQVAQIDSKDMDFAVWQALALRCAHWLEHARTQGLIVLHGTDTLEESAYFLHRVLPAHRPVVLTCAMRPATALAPDGPQNIVDAMAVARTDGASGVMTVCAGTVHGAPDVRKVHPYRLDAFSSGDAGALGYVEDGRLRRVRDWPQAQADASLLDRVRRATHWPQVEVVLSHAGASGRAVDALVADGVRGIVVAATGNGTVHHELEKALHKAIASGVRVVRSTRCTEGQLIAQAHDLLPSHPLSPVKARIDLLLDLLE